MSLTTRQTQALSEEIAALRAELVERPSLSVAEVERAYRKLSSAGLEPELRVAWLSNHTVDPVARHTTVAAWLQDVVTSDYVGPFNQYMQPILDPDSELHRFQPHVVILWLSMRGLAPVLVEGGGALDVEAHADRALAEVEQWVSAAKAATNATLFVANFPRPPAARLGIADASLASGDSELFARLNSRLAALFRDDPRVIVLDVSHSVAEAGSRSGWSPRMYRLAKMEWTGPAASAVGDLFARALRALVRPARKCVVVDLDNTLWGGVIGEDGLNGIRIAEGDPQGEAFIAFQRALLNLKARGVLLAICSKNNFEDAEEVFANLNMPLRWEDFVAMRINWQHKHANLLELARELNVGTDSLVFVDDNPAECELVRQMLPEVRTVQLPADPADYADLLAALPDFDKFGLTEEDSRKTEQYRENAARAESLANATDLARYLESLGTRLQIEEARPEHASRIHQLFTKTNQFNVTTKRYTPAEIETFMESDAWLLEITRATDNFGDMGIIGLYLVSLDSEEPEIDSFVMSCRAMGRGIETAMCNRLKRLVFEQRKSDALRARFSPTRKNKPVANFFDSQGFDLVSELDDGCKSYRLQRATGASLPVPGIVVIDTEV